jgi:uncharacterized protein YdaT
MPWTPNDAPRHTHKAKSEAERKEWASTANAVLKNTGDEGEAIRVANSRIGKKHKPAFYAK